MNGDNKISIAKGKVSQAGYDDAICTFIKADLNRKDSFSDKPLYILDDIVISDNMYAVTPSVTEALNRSTRKSIGVMNDEGELIVPIINSDIVKVNEKYVAVKTSSSIQEMETMKSDPNKVQQNAQISTQIKNIILDADPSARFICDDYYGTYDLYEINNNNLNRVCEGVSYIAISGNNIYAQTNNINDEVQMFGKTVEDPNVTMPVGILADVTEKTFDKLDVQEDAEIKDGAPELVNEVVSENEQIPQIKGENFKIDEVQSDLTEIKNEIELNNSSEQNEIEKPFNIEEKENVEVEDKKDEIKFADDENKDEFRLRRERIVKEDKPVGNLNTVVNAVKEKMNRLQDELTEKDQSLEDKEQEIDKKDKQLEELNKQLKEARKQLEENNEKMKAMEKEVEEKESKIITMESKIEEKDSKIAQYQKTMGEIYSEFSEMLDNSDEKKYYKVA